MARHGLHPDNPHTTAFDYRDGVRTQYSVIQCVKCATEHRFPSNKKRLLAPEVIARRARRLGWQLSAKLRDALCPACVARQPIVVPAQLPPVRDVPTEIPETTVEETTTMAQGQDEDKKLQRDRASARELNEVFNLLKEHCRREGDNAVYEEGWSDQRIADEVGVSKFTVDKIRQRETDREGKLIWGSLLPPRRKAASGLEDLWLEQAKQTEELAAKVAKLTDQLDLHHRAISRMSNELQTLKHELNGFPQPPTRPVPTGIAPGIPAKR